jgi:hypothetical protein
MTLCSEKIGLRFSFDYNVLVSTEMSDSAMITIAAVLIVIDKLAQDKNDFLLKPKILYWEKSN